MEELRQITDSEHSPIKGDNVVLNNRQGVLLDNDFNQIHWLDTDEIEDCIGGWNSFIEQGGFILVI